MEIEPSVIQIFSKKPVPGKVKTRLIPLLGQHKACRLQEIMLERLLNEVVKLGECAEIWTNSLVLHPLMVNSGFPSRIQKGKDLGEKMLHAITNGLLRRKRVVLIGSDLPPLDSTYIYQANKALDSYDVVFGPTEDGGFGLIATKIFYSGMFDGVKWSSSSVLNKIERNLSARSFSFFSLPYIWDVDSPNDLGRFFRFMNLSPSELGVNCLIS